MPEPVLGLLLAHNGLVSDRGIADSLELVRWWLAVDADRQGKGVTEPLKSRSSIAARHRESYAEKLND